VIGVSEIEGLIFKIVMDRHGVGRMKAILSGHDEAGREKLYDQIFQWGQDHKIDMDRWKDGRE
jgi:hypothetical protein